MRSSRIVSEKYVENGKEFPGSLVFIPSLRPRACAKDKGCTVFVVAS
jgi:hypothetical protein